jgi:hypothetical protein
MTKVYNCREPPTVGSLNCCATAKRVRVVIRHLSQVGIGILVVEETVNSNISEPYTAKGLISQELKMQMSCHAVCGKFRLKSRDFDYRCNGLRFK